MLSSAGIDQILTPGRKWRNLSNLFVSAVPCAVHVLLPFVCIPDCLLSVQESDGCSAPPSAPMLARPDRCYFMARPALSCGEKWKGWCASEGAASSTTEGRRQLIKERRTSLPPPRLHYCSLCLASILLLAADFVARPQNIKETDG